MINNLIYHFVTPTILFFCYKNMDLFQQTKQREEEKLRQQKSKLKDLRSKVHEKDQQIFDNSKTEEPSEENIIQNRHLLNFNAGELQTVYYDENDLEGDFIEL